MAMEHCLLQMSTTAAAARAGVPLQCYQYPNAISFNSQNSIASRRLSVQALSTTSASLSARSAAARTSRLVCNAAVNEVQVVTDSSWKSLVIGSETPVLVEFWAPWCGPCRMIAPVIDELAKEYSGKIACYKVNTDECPNIATEYGIRSIPTVIFFKNGEKKESVIGAVPKSTLSATIDKYLEL